MKNYLMNILFHTVRTFILILFVFDCNSKPDTSEEDAAVAFFLLSSEGNQTQNRNCNLRENNVVTSGSPLTSEVNATSTRCWMLLSLNSGGIQVDTNQSQDGAGFADVNDSASPVLFNWYTYNNTILTAKNNVYVIRDSKGTSFFKLQMLDYYSSSGTSGYPKFRWAKL